MRVSCRWNEEQRLHATVYLDLSCVGRSRGVRGLYLPRNLIYALRVSQQGLVVCWQVGVLVIAALCSMCCWKVLILCRNCLKQLLWIWCCLQSWQSTLSLLKGMCLDVELFLQERVKAHVACCVVMCDR